MTDLEFLSFPPECFQLEGWGGLAIARDRLKRNRFEIVAESRSIELLEYVPRRPSSRIRRKCSRDSVDGFRVKLERIRLRPRAENKEKSQK